MAIEQRKPLPSRERLRELFDYHPGGYFIRRLGFPGHPRGEEIHGTWNGRYLVTVVDKIQYRLHRLIYQWHHDWCPAELDHEDRNRRNCMIGNIRELGHSANVRNIARADNPGYGVFPMPNGKFKVQPMRDGVRYWLGYFSTQDEAVSALEAFNNGS